MQLSPKQDEAVQDVRRWIKSPDSPYYYLAGAAGTGKTTITKTLVEALDGLVSFAAYTGKAAFNMVRSGCVGATTIHKLIYKPREKSRQELKRLELMLVERGEDHPEAEGIRRAIEIERQTLSKPSFALNEQSQAIHSKLIVVDEVSMVDGRIAGDLLSFGVPLLVIGDPFQLPPVKGTGFFTTRQPNMFLTEIHRQARDNPIIQLATEVREGRALSLGDYGESRVVHEQDERIRTDVTSTDQVLVGMRKTRARYNERMRQLAGRDGALPVPGDKLVCLRNDHEESLMNGSLWTVEQVGDHDPQERQVYMTLRSADDPDRTYPLECWVWTEPLSTGESIWDRDAPAQSFTYGYALTVHKAQGSQWDDVVVFDESGVFRENTKRWLYTAVTRAAKRVTVVR